MADPNDDPSWGKYLSIGLEMTVGVMLGLFIGNWLDHRYGWSPWGVLIGTFLGIAAGMYLLIKDTNRMNKD